MNSGKVGGGPVGGVAVQCVSDPMALGGMVTGLRQNVTITLTNGSAKVVTGNGAYHFPTATVRSGDSYNVQVMAQPPAAQCTVTGGMGTVGDGDVDGVDVSCESTAFYIGGTVSGLQGSGLQLSLAGQNVAVTGSSYTFPEPVLAEHGAGRGGLQGAVEPDADLHARQQLGQPHGGRQ